MRYALLLKSHANVRYAQSLEKLALAELACLLQVWDISATPHAQDIAGARFLTFDADSLHEQAWRTISQHAAICFAASIEDELLRPLPLAGDRYLPEDIAEVLKYKGKTNADFTATALHCAWAASDFARQDFPLTVADPVCGRGTTLFCALKEGHNAVGIDMDAKAITEADHYFGRYLKYHKMKHRRETASVTLKEGGSAKEIRYSFADTSEHYQEGDKRTLRLMTGDTRRAGSILGKRSCHLMVGDLPYGVQHTSRQGNTLTSLEKMLTSALPSYAVSLKKGGAIALSFNAYTLPRKAVVQGMEQAGLTVMAEAPYADFSHWVEQAVNRDMVIARQEK